MVGLNAMSMLTRPLGPKRLTGVVGGLGVFAARIARVRRGVVDRNLATAFPEESKAWRKDIAERSYRHLGAQSALLLRMLDDSGTQERIMDRVETVDAKSADVLGEVRRRGEMGLGTLVLTGHLGNWEICASALIAQGIPLAAVGTRQSNPLFDRRLSRMRHTLGIEVVDRQEAARAVPRLFAEGRPVFLVADQFTWDGLPIRFFGQPTLAARGPATFARRARVPTVVVSALAEPEQPTRHRLHAHRLDEPAGRRGKSQAQAFLQRYFNELESMIRASPEQYLWHHRRWRPLEGRVDLSDLALLDEQPAVE